MSSAAITSAMSSIFAIQKQMNLASANIANADVDGYTAKSISTSTTVSGGASSGVTTSAASSTVDRYLLKDIAAATSNASDADATNSFYQALEQIFGSVSSDDTNGSDLSSLLSNLTTAASNLAATPDSEAYKEQLVTGLDDVAANFRSTSDSVQDMRSQADQEISDQVDEVNDALDQIASLNVQIRTAQASGESTADLEDQRMTALQSVASKIDVNYFVDQYGNMQIYTAGNQILLDRSGARHLEHTASSGLSSDVTYSGGGIDGITLNGIDITKSITTGSIASLVEQRDTILPNVQDELDNLAQSLSDTVNGIFNAGTASPPPSSLTGTADVDSSTGVTVASGTTLRVAITDADGKTVSTTDLDLSGATTVGDIAAALNTVSGVTAAVVDGHLSVSVSGDQGIALSTASGSIDGEDVSSYFGLNDVLTGGDSAATIAVRSDLLTDPDSLATGTLSSSLTVGTTAVGASDATVANALSDALTGKTSFASAGWLGNSTQSFSDYAANIVSSVATRADAASDNATSVDSTLSSLQTRFNDQSGVNVDNETATLSELQNAYSASAQVLSAVQSMFQSLLTAVQG